MVGEGHTAARMILNLKDGGRPTRPGAPPPSVTGPTIAELAEDYMTLYVAAHCKPSTVRACRHLFDKRG